MFYVTLLSVRKLVFCVLVVSTSTSPYWRHIQSALNSLGNSLGDCPHWVKSERKRRKVRGFNNVL